MENYCFHIATGRQEERDGKTLGCDKWQGCYLSVLIWRDLHLTLIFFQSFTKKDLFKRRWSLAEGFFKQNYCHACHTLRFACRLLPSSVLSRTLVHSAYALGKVKIQLLYGLNYPFQKRMIFCHDLFETLNCVQEIFCYRKWSHLSRKEWS